MRVGDYEIIELGKPSCSCRLFGPDHNVQVRDADGVVTVVLAKDFFDGFPSLKSLGRPDVANAFVRRALAKVVQ